MEILQYRIVDMETLQYNTVGPETIRYILLSAWNMVVYCLFQQATSYYTV